MYPSIYYVHSANTDNIKVQFLVDEMVFSGNEVVCCNVCCNVDQINCEDVVTFKLKMTHNVSNMMVYLDMDMHSFMSNSIVSYMQTWYQSHYYKDRVFWTTNYVYST